MLSILSTIAFAFYGGILARWLLAKLPAVRAAWRREVERSRRELSE